MSNSHVSAVRVQQTVPGSFFAEYRAAIQDAIMRVVDSGWYILGEEVERFEEEFAHHFGFTGAVGVANGTDAIVLALRALGVAAGDHVATVSHTAVATVAAIEMIGAKPVLVDIDSATYTLDPISLTRTLESLGPVKAVIAVHLYGHPADMVKVTQIARSTGAAIVEDCSQAHGALWQGKPVGSMGDAATFSFYPTKNLGALGDAGLVVSGDPALLKRAESLRQYGWERQYISEVPGINSRLDEVQAAILRVGLVHLEASNARRQKIAAMYTAGLAGTELILPVTAAGACHVYHQYAVRHPRRNSIREHLSNQGISTSIHYPVPVHRQPAYFKRISTDPAGLPISDQVAEEILSLPMYPGLKDEDVDFVVRSIRSCI
jgi:dTDP-4-amino-4,6-dideoxygalactose transaminase